IHWTLQLEDRQRAAVAVVAGALALVGGLAPILASVGRERAIGCFELVALLRPLRLRNPASAGELRRLPEPALFGEHRGGEVVMLDVDLARLSARAGLYRAIQPEADEGVDLGRIQKEFDEIEPLRLDPMRTGVFRDDESADLQQAGGPDLRRLPRPL